MLIESESRVFNVYQISRYFLYLWSIRILICKFATPGQLTFNTDTISLKVPMKHNYWNMM